MVYAMFTSQRLPSLPPSLPPSLSPGQNFATTCAHDASARCRLVVRRSTTRTTLRHLKTNQFLASEPSLVHVKPLPRSNDQFRFTQSLFQPNSILSGFPERCRESFELEREFCLPCILQLNPTRRSLVYLAAVTTTAPPTKKRREEKRREEKRREEKANA